MQTSNKKYQVFVSSTYEDLKEERQEIMNALLELDCIPSGMELFPAADEDQWSLIKGVIDECDYYVLVIGGRYGSTGPDGMGYTEKEYRYAIEQKKPIIAFLHKEPDALPKNKTETSEKGQNSFNDFRELAQKKMCKYWETPKELGSVVSRSLIMLQRKHPGTGWVKGDLVPDQEATFEILKLKKEIERLEQRLKEVRTEAPPGTEKLSQGQDDHIIYYKATSSLNYESYKWKDSYQSYWDEIFYHVAPIMIHEASDHQLRKALNDFIHEYALPALKKKKEIEEHGFGNIEIDEEDFQTIKVQLRALGLMTKSVKNRSVKDTQTYWTLTPYGDSVMNNLRAIERE